MNISGFINRDVHPQNFHLSISIVNKHTSLGQVELWIEPKSIKDMLIVLKMVVRFGEKQGWLNHVEWKVKFPARLSQEDIPRLKFHGLRHSFATRCIESHCDYKTVSVLLGLPLERSNVCSNE